MPFEEDSWKRIRIGDLALECVKPCSRCVSVNVDQSLGQKDDAEPLVTLATFRKFEGGVMFGQNCIQKNTGTVTVGAKVEYVA
jgi:uncharacterized protein YcbX